MQKRHLILFASFGLGSFPETLAAWELFAPGNSADHSGARVLVSHAAACAIFLPGFLLLFPPIYRREKWISLPLLLGLSIPLPVFGPILIVLFSQYVCKLNRAGTLEPNYRFGEERDSRGLEQSGGSSSTRSLLEHLHSPDTEVRRKAILAARTLDSQSAIPILRLAQQDSDEHVRIYARNSLGQITERLEASIKSLENEDLDRQQQLDRLIFIAEQFSDYVELGLLSEESRKVYLDRLIGLLNQSLVIEPHNGTLLCLLLKFCLLARYVDQAKIHLASLGTLASDPDATLPWELELCFESRDWRTLDQLLIRIRRGQARDPRLMKVYDFWQPKAWDRT